MKIIEIVSTQTVTGYFGVTVTTNDKGWLAADSNGKLFQYDAMPSMRDRLSCWVAAYGNDCELIATVDLEGRDWKDTLMEISS